MTHSIKLRVMVNKIKSMKIKDLPKIDFLFR